MSTFEFHAWVQKCHFGRMENSFFRVPMNPYQAWKAELEGALVFGIHNCKKISVMPLQPLDYVNNSFFPLFKKNSIWSTC